LKEIVPDNDDILNYYIAEEERLKRRYNKQLHEDFNERSDEDD
jgi:hypothetical protein